MKHTDLINKMSLEEKAAFLSGKTTWMTRDIERLGIPSIFCSDGPHGVRKQAGAGDHLGLNASLPATCFPTASTIANSWDESLGEKMGESLGEEAKSLGVDVLLGPGLNIKRNPYCGRNFEYFSEDPYLSGKMAAAYIRGIHSKGIYACPKHFAVNSQELRRMAMNAVLDERTMREIYLTGFEIAVKEGGAKTIMSSYNEVNGIYANENKHLLLDILREEWGFDGIVITDWGASNDHAQGVKMRSNLEMPAPGLDSAREIVEAIEKGSLTMEELNLCVDDLLDVVLTLSKDRAEAPLTVDKYTESHHEMARRAVEESAVLLKNEEHILPLKPGCKVAIIGDFAVEPRYQGAGSSLVNPTKVETMETVSAAYDIQVIGVEKGYIRGQELSDNEKMRALEIAQRADVVLYCFGLDEMSESEGLDRNNMRIPQKQIDLLEELLKVNNNIVGVLMAGSSIEMPWHSSFKAILHGYLTGQAGASALLNILTGKVNPSGKLAETYVLKYEDTPSYRYYPSEERNSEYREGIYVGYRYFDTVDVRVKYPFGFGLSYTTFEYSNLIVDENGATFTIKNTGDMDGAEVAQLYIGKNNSEIFRAKKELKGFKKVFLKTGESKRVTIKFDDKTFRYWNVDTNRWEIEGGVYSCMVGASVEDIRLEKEIEISGTDAKSPYNKEWMKSYFTGDIKQVEDAEFEQLLGRPVPDGKWSGELGKNDAICQMYYAKSPIARLVYRILTNRKKKSEAQGKPDLNILFIYNMPFRGIAKMTGGAVSREMVDGMVMAVNGHFFRGVGKLIGGFFHNRSANKKFEKKLNVK